MEKWKDIEGYEGLYQISNFGRVKSLPKKIKNTITEYMTKERILKGRTTSKEGRRSRYLMVALYRDKKRRDLSIHSLVAHHFIKPVIGTNLVVNHKDLDTYNNNVSNLEVVTQKENMKHYYSTKEGQEDILKRKENHSNPCLQLDMNGEVIKEWKSPQEAIDSGFSKHVYCVLNGSRKSTGGYKWKYK